MKKILVLGLMVLLSLIMITSVMAEVPRLINYQGRLSDKDGKPLDGVTKDVTFRIFDALAAGNKLWEEVHRGVLVQKGIFSILLGSVNNLQDLNGKDLAFDKPYYLEIMIEDEVLSPRQVFGSVPYAFEGVPRGVIVMWSGSIKDIPSGWVLCDGSKGTPDLRDRFIVGASQDDNGVAKTNVTGLFTQSGDGSIPSHSHSGSSLTVSNAGIHQHRSQWYSSEAHTASEVPGAGPSIIYNHQGATQGILMPPSGDHLHSISGNTGTSGTGIKNIATYYALAFIMKL